MANKTVAVFKSGLLRNFQDYRQLNPINKFHTSFSNNKDSGGSAKCIEKCNKKQLEVMSALGALHNKFLQPATKQLTGRKFVMSPPVIGPTIDVTLEESCRMKEECKKLAAGSKPKK